MFAGLTILTGMCGGLAGCSGGPPGTDEAVKAPLTQEQIKAEQAKVKEGMKTPGGGYQGPPKTGLPTR
jgi:hypothetical protein